MTTRKPPEPHKTLLGMPSDLQAALDKLKAEEDAARAAYNESPHGAQRLDPDRTQFGHPYSSGGPKSVPPPLPGQRATLQPIMPPSAARRVESLQRTLIGVIPSHLQEHAHDHEVSWSEREPPAQSEERLARTQSFATPVPVSEPRLDVTQPLSAEPEARAASQARYRDPDAPRLTLARDQATRRVRAPKRWPALALIGLAVATLAAVVALRTPALLPQPLAALFSARPAPPPPAVPQVTAIAAATADPADAPRAEPPRLRGAASGATAELEKQALDLLVANDYSAAARVYTRLREAEPERTEYAVMLRILARESKAASCGQPGQAPCNAP